MQLSKRFRLLLLVEVIVFVSVAGCYRNAARQIKASSYPLAAYPEKVGSYPALTKSGAGYFYDEVLEYRVWINPPEGDDYYKAFIRYEDALEFSRQTLGGEEPIVLILQKQWVDEPEPGIFIVRNEVRITEWRVEWLSNSKRESGAIERFLEEHKDSSHGHPSPSTSPQPKS
jgi:putative acetyltransferase